MLATLQGVEAVKAVLEATPETPSPVICIVENKIVRKSLLDAVALTHKVADAIESKDFGTAMKLRDAEFTEYFNAYNIMTSTEKEEMKLPQEKVCAGQSDNDYEAETDTFIAPACRYYPRRCSSRWYERGHSCCDCLLSHPRPHSSCDSQRFPRPLQTPRRQA